MRAALLLLSTLESPEFRRGRCWRTQSEQNDLQHRPLPNRLLSYSLPFCQPPGGPKMDGRNVSEILAGDCIQTSPYRLTMKVDMYCKQLCVADLSHGEMKGESPNEMGRAIRKKYHNNWIVDNIPAASTVEDDSQVITRYSQGFLMGFIAGDTKKAYVHNHVNIEIQYHAVETDPTKGRIVRFSVEPFSIKHELEASANDDDGPPVGEEWDKEHTKYGMVYARGREPQEAAGRVLFTYDVIWRENKELHWALRWDIYLSMVDAIPASVRWFDITKSLVAVILLAAILVWNLGRDFLRDFTGYNRLANGEETAEGLEEFG
ncbi:hypothetical protein ACHAXN_004686 [Cyclotella atomus]